MLAVWVLQGSRREERDMEKERGNKQDENKERWSEEKEGSRKEWTKIRMSSFSVASASHFAIHFRPVNPVHSHRTPYMRCYCLEFRRLLCGSDSKESASNAEDLDFDPWIGKISWRKEWQPTPVFLPGELHGQRSLVGYSLWGHKRVRHNWND